MIDDKLIEAINDFKKNIKSTTTPIHGKDYATVAPRVAILRRNLGSTLDIKTELLHHDDKRVVVKADISINGVHVASGLADANTNLSPLSVAANVSESPEPVAYLNCTV